MQKSNEKDCKCPHCGASMLVHKHNLSKGVVKSLVKMKQAIFKFNRNSIHLEEIGLNTSSQFNNFQKLRYFGLIAKYEEPKSKKNLAGYWLLTKRGNQFLKGEIAVSRSVYTFRNKIVDRDQVKLMISEILSDPEIPEWQERLDFPFDYADLMDIEDMKVDANGQGLINLFI